MRTFNGFIEGAWGGDVGDFDDGEGPACGVGFEGPVEEGLGGAVLADCASDGVTIVEEVFCCDGSDVAVDAG